MKKAAAHPNFKDVVAEVTNSVPVRVRVSDGAWPTPIQDGFWIDGAGRYWQLRQPAGLDRRKTMKLLLDPAVRVVLIYGTEPDEIPPTDWDALWHRMEPVMRGRSSSKNADFLAARFSDDDGNALLMIQEYC